MSYSEIAQKYGFSVSWVHKKAVQFGLKITRSEKKAVLDKKIPEMLRMGLTIDTIAQKNNCSSNTIKKWLDENLEYGIVKFRHDNDIILQHKDSTLDLMLSDLMQKCLDAGYSLKKIAQLFNLSKPQALRIKQKYGLKSQKDYSYELLDKFLPDMIKHKDRLKTMSRLTGLSRATIARYIRSLNDGKNYIDIRLER